MCSDCKMLAWCGQVSNPLKTGESCPSFVQWTSRYAWMHEALQEAHDAMDTQEDVPAWVLAMEDAYANREMPWT